MACLVQFEFQFVWINHKLELIVTISYLIVEFIINFFDMIISIFFREWEFLLENFLYIQH